MSHKPDQQLESHSHSSSTTTTTTTTSTTVPPTITSPADSAPVDTAAAEAAVPDAEMPVTNGKRRVSVNPPHLSAPIMPSSTEPSLKPSYSTHDDLRHSITRRRKFIVYSIVLAVLIGISSVLDVRRTSLRNRQAKIQLQLPSSSSLSSLSSLSDSITSPSSSSSSSSTSTSSSNSQHSSHASDLSLPLGHPTIRPPTVAAPVSSPRKPDTPARPHAPIHAPVSASDLGHDDHDAKPPGVNVSDQELKDSVDQLIAHVDEEEQTSATVSNTTSAVATGPTTADAQPPPAVPVPPAPHAPPVVSDTNDTRLNSQEHFDGAQKRLQALMADEETKTLVDENDHRTLQALALQATRGDCTQKTGFFKTDAEAASNDDVERTDPLWGAWCLFMGSYKSDAMRDFVTKLRVVEEKVASVRDAMISGGNVTASVDTGFDPNAASLDDILTSDQQSALRSQMETISSHLSDEDRRYLAALSLQATFGDCGPYGREPLPERKEGEEKPELRKLREPLLDETVVRRSGALWGSWCVMQGKKRTAASGELTSRVELLVEQLSKTRAAAAAAAAPTENSSANTASTSATSGSDTSSAIAASLSNPESQIPAVGAVAPSAA